jgi:hypothetical protein
MEGVTRLDTGRFDPNDPKHNGEMLEGPGAHSDVTRARGSTAWQNIVGVVTGGEVTLYTEPTVIPLEQGGGYVEYPYQNKDFEGPKVDVE